MSEKELIANALEEQGILTKNTLAYALSTIDHETGGTFKPVREGWWLDKPGQEGQAGKQEAIKRKYDGGENYYGRGFIQLTGKNNYLDMGKKLGMGTQLADNPDLVLQPEIAAKILALFFKDKKINVTADRGDFVAARARINGTDKAQEIADLANKYLPESDDIIVKVKNLPYPGFDINDISTDPIPNPNGPSDRAFSYNEKKAREIQQEYNKSLQGVIPWARPIAKLFMPKPAFSAENNNSQQSTNVQKADLSFMDNPKLTQGFGAKTFSFYGKGGHEGVDFHATKGTPVKGYSGWIVDFSGQNESYYGNQIILRNPQTNEKVQFVHLDKLLARKGQVLGNNQLIATTGNSGYRPDGQPQQAHLQVNYYSPEGKQGDFYKQAKNAGNDFPMVASVNSIIDKAKGIASGIVNPKQVSAAEPTATPVGTPIKEGQPNPQLRPEQDPNQPGAYNGKSVGNISVKPGDTLTSLARQHNTTVNDFMRMNPSITNQNKIYSNQVINVPSAPTPTSQKDGYTIRSGDTLTSIAKNLGTTVNDLVRKNGIQNPNLIRAGTKIKL